MGLAKIMTIPGQCVKLSENFTDFVVRVSYLYQVFYQLPVHNNQHHPYRHHYLLQDLRLYLHNLNLPL